MIRSSTNRLLPFLIFTGVTGLIARANAADWTNSGGNAARNCITSELGPTAAMPLWSGGRPSIIAWQPVIEGNRVFMVRELTFPPTSVPNDAYIVAMDLNTGGELWAKTVPYNTGEWIPWIAGVKNGRVFVSRSTANAGIVPTKLYALDVATGDTLWDSDDTTVAGAYDGVVFAPDGDPILASHVAITRINAEDGTTVWNRVRDRAVSGACGGAIFGDALYIDGLAPGGQVIERRDLATGNYMYETPVMAGITEQNWPFVGPDGTVYISRTQNNVAVDFFYAFEDTGSALTLKWFVPAGWSTISEFTVGPDGSVYMIAPGRMLSRLDPDDGSVMDDVGPIPSEYPNGLLQPRMAVDSAGKVYFSNGLFSSGRLWCFTPDLNEIWSVPVPNINIGGPVIGSNGTLIVAGTGTDVRAYRTPSACNPCDADCSGAVDANDLTPFVDALLNNAAGCSPCRADTNHDLQVNGLDVSAFVVCLIGP